MNWLIKWLIDKLIDWLICLGQLASDQGLEDVKVFIFPWIFIWESMRKISSFFCRKKKNIILFSTIKEIISEKSPSFSIRNSLWQWNHNWFYREIEIIGISHSSLIGQWFKAVLSIRLIFILIRIRILDPHWNKWNSLNKIH